MKEGKRYIFSVSLRKGYGLNFKGRKKIRLLYQKVSNFCRAQSTPTYCPTYYQSWKASVAPVLLESVTCFVFLMEKSEGSQLFLEQDAAGSRLGWTGRLSQAVAASFSALLEHSQAAGDGAGRMAEIWTEVNYLYVKDFPPRFLFLLKIFALFLSKNFTLPWPGELGATALW